MRTNESFVTSTPGQVLFRVSSSPRTRGRREQREKRIGGTGRYSGERGKEETLAVGGGGGGGGERTFKPAEKTSIVGHVEVTSEGKKTALILQEGQRG